VRVERSPVPLCRRVAAAADLCLKPHLHAVVACDGFGETSSSIAPLRIQARSSDGTRLPLDDIELRSTQREKTCNLMLSWPPSRSNPCSGKATTRSG